MEAFILHKVMKEVTGHLPKEQIKEKVPKVIDVIIEFDKDDNVATWPKPVEDETK